MHKVHAVVVVDKTLTQHLVLRVLGFLEGLVALGAEEVVMVGKTLTGLSPLLEPNTQITAFGSHLPAETSHHTHFPDF